MTDLRAFALRPRTELLLHCATPRRRPSERPGAGRPVPLCSSRHSRGAVCLQSHAHAPLPSFRNHNPFKGARPRRAGVGVRGHFISTCLVHRPSCRVRAGGCFRGICTLTRRERSRAPSFVQAVTHSSTTNSLSSTTNSFGSHILSQHCPVPAARRVTGEFEKCQGQGPAPGPAGNQGPRVFGKLPPGIPGCSGG